MILVSYMYETETILSFRRATGERCEIVLPRQGEFVDVADVTYRIVSVTHVFSRVFSRDDNGTKQQIIIKLTRRLVIE